MENLKEWLGTLNPEMQWNLDDMDALEKQIVDTIKVSGYINFPLLIRHLNKGSA